MKMIVYNIDLRLNPQDEYAVICPTAIPYSKENFEYAKACSVDGKYTTEEWNEPEAQPTDTERITQLEEALEMLLSGVTE